MKKFILLFSLIIVFILSLIINFDNPAISITLSAKSDNIQPPKINVSQKNTKNENIDFYSILPLSDCNLIIGLKNYESSFQRKLLGNFAVIISGSERTSELTRQDIVLPLNNGMSAEIAVIKHNPFLWNYLGVIYKFILLFFSFALVYGISLISVNHKDEILSFLNKDWPHEIAVFARNVNPLYYKTFLISFAAMNIVFLYHTVHFIWGNHDWNFVKYGLGWFGAVWGGRITENFFAKLLFGGDVLPVLYNLFNFASFSAGALLLCHLWKVPKNLFSYLSVSLLFLLTPYTLSWLFMVNMIHFSLPAIALGGILFALKAGEEKQKRKNTFNALSVFFILYAFFAYPPVLSTIAVVFCGMCFMECFFEEKNLKEICHKFRFIVADILVSGIIFKISLKILPYLSGNVDPNAYMTQNVGGSAFFKGIIPTLQSVFLQFAVTQPFLDFNYKMLWAALVIVSAAAAIFSAFRRKMNKTTFFCSVIIFLIAMCASQTSVFISLDKRIMFSTRIAMFGLLFFYVFVYAMLIKQKGNIFRNAAFVFFILLSLGGISRNANAQKIWKLGFDAEKANIMQIAHAIESHPAFDPGKKYIYVAFGKQHPFREDYYFEHYDLPDERMLNYPFTPDWVPHVPLLFFARNNYIENGYSVFNGCLTPKNIQEAINEDLADFKANAKPWPMPGSVLVNDKYIAVMFDRGTL